MYLRLAQDLERAKNEELAKKAALAKEKKERKVEQKRLEGEMRERYVVPLAFQPRSERLSRTGGARCLLDPDLYMALQTESRERSGSCQAVGGGKCKREAGVPAERRGGIKEGSRVALGIHRPPECALNRDILKLPNI